MVMTRELANEHRPILVGLDQLPQTGIRGLRVVRHVRLQSLLRRPRTGLESTGPIAVFHCRPLGALVAKLCVRDQRHCYGRFEFCQGAEGLERFVAFSRAPFEA